MSIRGRSLRPALLASVVAAGLAVSGSAHAQVVSEPSTTGPILTTPSAALAGNSKSHVSNYIDLFGSIGYSSNPLVAGNSGSGYLVGRLSATAVHSVVRERSSVQVSAYVENQTYSKNYGSTQIFDLEGRASYVASEKLNLFGSVGFNGDIAGQLGSRFYGVLPATPTDVNNPLVSTIVIVDPNQVGLNTHQYRLSGSGGLSYSLSARDSLNASAGYSHVFYSGNARSLDFDTASLGLGWSRVFSERTSGGLQLSAQRADYGSRGHAVIISPQVTVHTRLTEGWDASAAVGVSIVDERTTTGHDKSVNLAASGSICRTTETENICGSVSRSAQTSLGQSVVVATSAGLSYSRRLSAKDTVQANAGASRTSAGNTLLTSRPATYVNADASYSRHISPRLSTGVEGGVRKLIESGYHLPIDVSASVFLRYRLGDLQ